MQVSNPYGGFFAAVNFNAFREQQLLTASDMPKRRDGSIKAFLIEIAIYAGLVVGYFFLVLHFLNDWLKSLFDWSKGYYAIVALLLIIIQGIVLETITTFLVKVIGSKID